MALASPTTTAVATVAAAAAANNNRSHRSTRSRGHSTVCRIPSAIVQATLLWCLVYFILVQALVALQWDTVHPVVYNNVLREIVLPEEEEIIFVDADDDAMEMDPLALKRQRSLLLQIAQAKTRQSQSLDQLQRDFDLLLHNVKNVNHSSEKYPLASATSTTASTTASATTPLPLPSLSMLLNQPSLRKIKEQQLNSLLDKALMDLKDVMDVIAVTDEDNDDNNNNNDTKKNRANAIASLRTLLNSDTFLREKTMSLEGSSSSSLDACPPPPSATGVREADLKNAVDKIKEKMDRMYAKFLQPMLVEMDPVVETLVHSYVDEYKVVENDDDDDNTMAAVPNSPPDIHHDNDSPTCLLEDELHEMLELALKTTDSDIRMALTNMVQQLEPDSTLILDAPLLPPAETLRSLSSSPPTKTVRQALNSELLYTTTSNAIDVVVDQLSGYFDTLDQAMDALLASSSTSSSSSSSMEASVGRILVSRLLDTVGNIPVPSVIQDIQRNSKAGMLHL